MEKEEASNNIVQTLEASFEQDKVISINMKIQTLLNEKYVPYIDSFVTQMEEQFSNYKDKKGITSMYIKMNLLLLFLYLLILIIQMKKLKMNQALLIPMIHMKMPKNHQKKVDILVNKNNFDQFKVIFCLSLYD